MSSSNFPPGFRFLPVDEELLKYYLKPKLNNSVLPCDAIKEVQLYNYSPQQLADMYKYNEESEEDMCFFTPRVMKYKGGKRPSRKAGDGFWKATEKVLQVKDSETEEVIGYKMVLTYHAGQRPNDHKTNWIMHEYHVDKNGVIPPSAKDMKLDHWILCRVYKHQQKGNKKKVPLNVPCNYPPKSALIKVEYSPLTDNQLPEVPATLQYVHDNAVLAPFPDQLITSGFPDYSHCYNLDYFNSELQHCLMPDHQVMNTNPQIPMEPPPQLVMPSDHDHQYQYYGSTSSSYAPNYDLHLLDHHHGYPLESEMMKYCNNWNYINNCNSVGDLMTPDQVGHHDHTRDNHVSHSNGPNEADQDCTMPSFKDFSFPPFHLKI